MKVRILLRLLKIFVILFLVIYIVMRVSKEIGFPLTLYLKN